MLDLEHIAKALQQRDISPVELLHDCLERIGRLNPALNALVTLDEAGAVEAARQSEARQRVGARRGPLDGVPLSIKDNLFVGGLRATWGSRLYEQFVPDEDDVWVARLRAAGAVIVGKTNTPEFALATHTENAVFGATRNPASLEHVPGGSSGGAAASVASGMLPLAIGTDAGGSIRLPASFTGVVGFKPSLGRIPRVHGFPPMVSDFQVIGLMASSVAGVELAFELMQGPDERDRASLAFSGGAWSETPHPVRVGVLEDIGGEPVEPEVRQAVRHAADLLSREGFHVEPAREPYDLDAIKRFWPVLSSAGLARVLSRFPPERRAEATPPMAALAEQGARVTGVEYANALDLLGAFRAEAATRFGPFDLLLTPTSPVLPWKSGEGPPATIGGRPLNPRTPLAFCTYANATGYPAISIPWTASGTGLPIGLQLIARYGRDPLLLHAGRQLQRLAGASRPGHAVN